MAQVVITMQIMPENPEVDLSAIQTEATKMIADFGAEVGKVEYEPVAFGLKALKLIFVSDENKGDTEKLEEKISAIPGVMSVEVTDVRRAIG